MNEFTDKKGDRWVIRECENDDHCVVVEVFMKPRHATVPDDLNHIDGLLEAMQPRDDEPLNSFHIPLESLGDLIDTLREFDRNAGKAPHAQ